MKKLLLVIPSVIIFIVGCSKYDDGELWDKVNSLDNRLTAVENSLSQMNSNVTSLQKVVHALQNNVYVTEVKTTNTGYSITFSDGTKANIQNGTDGLSPFIGTNGNWWIGTTDTGVKAAATDGITPRIGNNGNWWIGDTDTGVKAAATDGQTPYIGTNGNWWIGTTDTKVKAAGIDGMSPNIGDNGNWWIGTTDTGVKAAATDGITPNIGSNGNWWIGDKDTGIKAAGIDGQTPYVGDNGNWWIGNIDTGNPSMGKDGISPTIGANGNWWFGSTDTGVKAKGNDGITPSIGDNGNWWIGTFDTGVKAIGINGETPFIGTNGNWWIGTTDTGVKAGGSNGKDGETPFIGKNGNWWIGTTDTGVKASGSDGITPRIGDNGNWWIGTTDTGVKAGGSNGKDGETPFIGTNGNWWIGTKDTGVKAGGSNGKDGETPYIGKNGNWWIGTKDTGVKAGGSDGKDGETPYIGDNGNWWVGKKDTGVKATGSGETTTTFPIIGIDIYEGNYYWTQTINGVTTWLLGTNGVKIPVGGYTPIFKIDIYGYIVYSYDGGVTWIDVTDNYGYPLIANKGCECTQFFLDVFVYDDYLYLILIDGTEVKIRIKDDATPRGGIPEDPTTPTPIPNDPNTPLPYPNLVLTIDDWGNYVLTMDITGIQDPYTGEWLSLYGTNYTTQNIWVDIDGSPKGILVTNLEDNTTTVKNDIVFTVDNSGSMGNEANAIANGINNWASMLASKGLDVKFGVVGYGGNVGSEYDYLVNNYGVTGAMDFSTSSELSSYLNRSTGTSRTKGYYGANSTSLQSTAAQSQWSRAGGENGAQAIRFANENFSFRATANRIYVNFTDDCNFTGKNDDISVNYFNNRSKWGINNGTVHSVISNDKNTLISRASSYESWELPWLISEYTNGTIMFIKSDASDLQLDKLTVSEAITHSYTIKMIISESLFDGNSHTLRIVVIANDGTVKGLLEFNVTFGR